MRTIWCDAQFLGFLQNEIEMKFLQFNDLKSSYLLQVLYSFFLTVNGTYLGTTTNICINLDFLVQKKYSRLIQYVMVIRMDFFFQKC